MSWLSILAAACRLIGLTEWAAHLLAAHHEAQRLQEQANATPLTDQEEADRLLK